MKKYIFLVILIVIATMPVFSQAYPYIGIFSGIGGGPDIGFELTILGVQFGVELHRPFNFLLEASGGFGFFDESTFDLNYHLGGLIELRIEEIFLLGAGGGVGGGTLFGQPYYYPYIRGSASVQLMGLLKFLKLGLYYDYGFSYGSMFGFRIHLCFSKN